MKTFSFLVLLLIVKGTLSKSIDARLSKRKTQNDVKEGQTRLRKHQSAHNKQGTVNVMRLLCLVNYRTVIVKVSVSHKL